jgi:hypothetical protein
MAERGRGRGRGGVPPNPPPSPSSTIEQLLAVQTQLMQQLVQNQHNQPIAGAQPRDKCGEFLKGRTPVFTHAADPLEADDWLRAVKGSSTLHNVMTGRRCCLLLDNSREKLRIGGNRISMVALPMLLRLLGRSLERTSGLTIYQKG